MLRLMVLKVLGGFNGLYIEKISSSTQLCPSAVKEPQFSAHLWPEKYAGTYGSLSICRVLVVTYTLIMIAVSYYGVLTSHIRLLFLHRSTCSGEMTLPVNGPISVPALIQVLEKMPSPSPGMELWAMITSEGRTRLESFCTSAGNKDIEMVHKHRYNRYLGWAVGLLGKL